MADPFYDIDAEMVNEQSSVNDQGGFWDSLSEFGYSSGTVVGYLTGYSTERGNYMQEVKLSTAVNVRVTMRANDGTGPMVGLTLTVKIAKNGDVSFSTISPTVTPLGSGVYNIALSTTDTNTLGALSVLVTSSTVISGATAIPESLRLLVVAVDKADAANFGLSSLAGAATASAVTALDTKVGTPAGASVSVDIAAVQTKLGTPAAASVSQDIADVRSDTSLLPAAAPKIDILHQIETGRWKIQGTQLLLYDTDNTTVIYAFDLKDDTGAPSSTKIFERFPA